MVAARDVAEAIRAELGHDPGAVKLHKLLYYCQAWHATWTDQPLFPEVIEAWEMGPVVADLWREERYAPKAADEDLTEQQNKTVHYVVKRYGRRWAKQLIGDTHAEAPWRDAYGEGRNTVITIQSMCNFFRRDTAADQAWFWDPAWLAGEHEADEDIREGRVSSAMSEDEFLASL